MFKTWMALCAGAAALATLTTASLAQQPADEAGVQDGQALTVEEIDPDELEAAEIRLRQYLRGQGYDRIRFVGLAGGGSAQFRVCQGTALIDLLIDRFGRIAGGGQVGECEERDLMDSFIATLTSEELSDAEVKIVEDQVLAQGYTRVELLDKSAPEMDAIACRGRRKFALEVDADGGVLDSRRNQSCQAIAAGPERAMMLRRSLRARGYTSIRFIDSDGSARRALACNGVRYFDMTFTADGAIQQRGVIGFCPTRLNFAALPPRPVAADEIPAEGRLEPQLCQDVISQMIYARPINFEFAKADLTPDSVAFLGDVAAVLARCQGTRLLVEGHTDNVGSDAANAGLSLRRAQAVATVLNDYGITGRAVAAAGFGEGFPIATNDTDEGRAANRRIELTLQWGGD